MGAVEDHFEGKPESFRIFKAVHDRISALGFTETAVKSQISIAVNRKFAWFWLYNVTQKNPNGILHVMLALDREIDDAHVRDISRVGKNRWNHQIVIRSLDDAKSEWLSDLLEEAFAYGSR